MACICSVSKSPALAITAKGLPEKGEVAKTSTSKYSCSMSHSLGPCHGSAARDLLFKVVTVNYSPFTHMADGTIIQINPLLGTAVWTVPGRGNRPLEQPQAMTGQQRWALCLGRSRELPPR